MAAEEISELVAAAGGDPTVSALYIIKLEGDDVLHSWESGGGRIDQRYPPASTAKIPHTLIALESGYVTTPYALFPWDGQIRSMEVWNQDQTLATAYSRSCIWVYQQILSALGHKTMAGWMENRLCYGNQRLALLKI